MILRLYLEAEIVTRAILATLLSKIFPGELAPDPPRWVRLWRTAAQNSFDKGPMLHSDPGPLNPLRGPGLKNNLISNCQLQNKLQDYSLTPLSSEILSFCGNISLQRSQSTG